MTRINVTVPYYRCGDPERQAELDTCVENNIGNPLIEKIILLIDNNDAIGWDSPKIEVVRLDRRPTYLDWIDLTNGYPDDEISLLCNADIYFDATLRRLPEYLSGHEEFLALTRWDVQGGEASLHANPHWSQDVWAFRCGARMSPTLMHGLDIPLGVPRCDNKIAYKFSICGWTLVNPCNDIKAYHLHETEFRTYSKTHDDRILGGTAYVHPTRAPGEAARIDIDIWAKHAHHFQKVSINKSLDRWALNQSGPGADNSAPEQRRTPPAASALPAASASPVITKGIATGLEMLDAAELTPVDFLRNGEVVYEHGRRFLIHRLGNRILYWDRRAPRAVPDIEPAESIVDAQGRLAGKHLAHWIRPVTDIAPLLIKDRPADKLDCWFWQYPAATERQARDNHAGLRIGTNVDPAARVIHTYLPLPWASFIDKKAFPPEIAEILTPRLAALADLARENFYRLRVHTVCQHIRWRRLLPQFVALGITDLHLSHCEKGLVEELAPQGLSVHSWPLFAVNVEDPARRMGLTVGKPAADRRYLASFIGAHMPHYRSEARLALKAEAERDGGADLIVEVNDLWHYNRIVYHEQAQHKVLDASDTFAEAERTLRYNQVLSDSVFSLCPEGSGPNTLRLWESLAVGSIPVVIADDWVMPNLQRGDFGLADACVVIARNQIAGLYDRLRATSPDELASRQTMALTLHERARNLTAFSERDGRE